MKAGITSRLFLAVALNRVKKKKKMEYNGIFMEYDGISCNYIPYIQPIEYLNIK